MSKLREARSLIWHPEEKLWNWRLVGALRRMLGGGAPAYGAISALIGIDSLLLLLRVWRRRLRRPSRSRRPDGRASRPPVLYIDCGVHKRGEQIRWMHRWFADRYELRVLGFEASAEHVRDATVALADLDGVRLFHLALVGPEETAGEVRLYKSPVGQGKGDSLFANSRGDYDVVPARRLSDVLAEEGCSLSELPVVLRMNIEGAEQFVIRDLIDAGLHTCVDGYYGMWDDLAKIDPPAARTFRRLLRDNGISSITFNDRDLEEAPPGARASLGPAGLVRRLRERSFALRRHAIRSDIEAALQAGLRRVGHASHGSTDDGAVTASSPPITADT
jgi:FkbM family methyltransferase